MALRKGMFGYLWSLKEGDRCNHMCNSVDVHDKMAVFSLEVGFGMDP